jgi:hypothetical protein
MQGAVPAHRSGHGHRYSHHEQQQNGPLKKHPANRGPLQPSSFVVQMTQV